MTASQPSNIVAIEEDELVMTMNPRKGGPLSENPRTLTVKFCRKHTEVSFLTAERADIIATCCQILTADLDRCRTFGTLPASCGEPACFD